MAVQTRMGQYTSPNKLFIEARAGRYRPPLQLQEMRDKWKNKYSSYGA
jgi:hypothetical protein